MSLRVPYSEDGVKDGSSPTYSASWDKPLTGKRRIRVKFSDVREALQQLVGYSSAAFVGDRRVLRRELPEFDPIWFNATDTTRPQLVCTSANVVKNEHWTGRSVFNAATGALMPGFPNAVPTKDASLLPTTTDWKSNVFKTAVIEANYTMQEFTIRPDAEIDAEPLNGNEFWRFLTEREDRAVRSLVVPSGSLYFIVPIVPAPPLPAAQFRTEAIPFSVPILEYESTLYLKSWQWDFDAVPWATIRNCIGKVNHHGAANGPLTNYPEYTLLYLPPRVELFPMINGRLGCHVEHCIAHQPAGWGKLIRVANNERKYRWVTANSAATAEPTTGVLTADKFLYNSADLSKVWDPNAG